MGLNLQEAICELRKGKRLSRGGWTSIDPSFVVLIASREITPTYEPMVTHLKSRPFRVQEHIDAIFDHEARGQVGGVSCVVGYQLSQADILATDWFVDGE